MLVYSLLVNNTFPFKIIILILLLISNDYSFNIHVGLYNLTQSTFARLVFRQIITQNVSPQFSMI